MSKCEHCGGDPEAHAEVVSEARVLRAALEMMRGFGNGGIDGWAAFDSIRESALACRVESAAKEVSLDRLAVVVAQLAAIRAAVEPLENDIHEAAEFDSRWEGLEDALAPGTGSALLERVARLESQVEGERAARKSQAARLVLHRNLEKALREARENGLADTTWIRDCLAALDAPAGERGGGS